VKPPLDVFVVAGARPNFMKVAPVLNAMKRRLRSFTPVFVHTGQHYDDKMSKSFLRDLGLPDPDVYLGVGSASHAVQTSRIMIAFEKAVVERKCGLAAVVGDVNSTLACALVAAKQHIPVAHIEAGLRSRDRDMPEEINRIVADHLSDILFTTCRDGGDNLLAEGVPGEKIHFVGNVMIESLIMNEDKIDASGALERLDMEKGKYALITLHRPSNVDDPEDLGALFKMLRALSERLPVVFPVHPRTKAVLESAGWLEKMKKAKRILPIDPVDYLDMVALEKQARLVLTDSGGVQKEAYFFGVPCITLRGETEWVETVEDGWNIVVGTDAGRIVDAVRTFEPEKTRPGRRFGDGRAAERMAELILKKM
jgi:UDP-N-acetylglucosamine 2-epimerase (non-hydrolysing)